MSTISQLRLRKHLERNLQKLLDEKSLVSVLFLDIDGFKPVNDTFGHEVGNIRLDEVVTIMEEIARHKGKLYRWGGDEFCITMQNYDAGEAGGTAERIREAVDALPLVENALKNTLSIGVVCSKDWDVPHRQPT